MATISRFHAVVSFKGIRVSGFLGWLIWLFVHLTFLTGFKNRLATVPRWAVTFIGNGPPERTITIRQVVGRVAIEEAGGRPFLMSLVGEAQPTRGRADRPDDRQRQSTGSRRSPSVSPERPSSRPRSSPAPGWSAARCATAARSCSASAAACALRRASARRWGSRCSTRGRTGSRGRRFAVAGREVDLDAHPELFRSIPTGLPIHGLLAAAAVEGRAP